MSHTLVLLRHGKSVYPKGVKDHQRPLAPRGHRQAKLAGEWIREHVGDFDLILCSTSVRTRMTLEEADLKGPVKYLDDLYTASHHAYLDVIEEDGGKAKKVALVGHEPAISATALALISNRDSKPARVIESKFPTSAVAVLQGPRSFSDLETGRMTLEHFYVPERHH